MSAQRLKINEAFGANVSRGSHIPGDNLLLTGTFRAEVWRPMGVKLEKRLIGVYNGKNAATTAGKNRFLNAMFGAASPVLPIDPWYIGLINNSPTPTLLTGDTLASHSGWTESTDYSGNRKEWNDADGASGTKASSSVSTFSMNATVTIYGIFITGLASGTSGAAVNAVQTITPTGTISGGTWTFTWKGVTSSAIAYNANAATIETALETMANIGVDDLTVSGGPLSSGAVTLTFTDGLAGQPQPLGSVNGASLTGGGTIAIAHTTYGRSAAADILWSEGAFSSTIALTSGDDLKCTYSLGLT